MTNNSDPYASMTLDASSNDATTGEPTYRRSQYYDFLEGQPEQLSTAEGVRVVYGHVNVKNRKDLEFWWLELRDLRGGLNKTYGDWDTDWDRGSSSTLDTRFPRTLCLPMQGATTSATPTGNLSGFHSSFIYGNQYFALGSGNDVSLWKETSATNPAPTAITGVGSAGRPGAVVCSLSNIVIGGSNNAQALLIGLVGAVPILMTDAAGTLSGTAFDAALNSCYGAIQTPLNNRSIVFLAGAAGSHGWKTLAASDAINTTPVNSALAQPRGGYAAHPVPFRLGNGPLRLWWGMPYEETPNGVLLFGTEKLHRIVSTNIEGTDPQDEDVGLKGVLQYVCIPGYAAIAAHDGERMVLYRGDSAPQDLRLFEDREPNSDRTFRLRRMYVNGPELVYEVNYIASTNGTGDTQSWWEAYHIETGAQHQISAVTTHSGVTGVVGPLTPGSAPISKNTNFAQHYANTAFRRLEMVPYGYNPHKLLRQTSGAGSSTGSSFEATGTWTGPYLELPGLEGLPKIISRIVFLGDAESAGTAATAGYVTTTCDGMGRAVTFTTGFSNRAQVADIRPGDCGPFFLFKPSITGVRTTASVKFTPNCLPIRYEGFAYRDTDAEAALVPPASIFQFVAGR